MGEDKDKDRDREKKNTSLTVPRSKSEPMHGKTSPRGSNNKESKSPRDMGKSNNNSSNNNNNNNKSPRDIGKSNSNSNSNSYSEDVYNFQKLRRVGHMLHEFLKRRTVEYQFKIREV